MADEFVDVGGGGVVGVDDEAAVFFAHLGASDGVAAQAGIHDELAGKVALGALEGGAGARHVERLLVLAALAVVSMSALIIAALPGARLKVAESTMKPSSAMRLLRYPRLSSSTSNSMMLPLPRVPSSSMRAGL